MLPGRSRKAAHDGGEAAAQGRREGARSANGRQFSPAFQRRRMDGARFPEGKLDFRREGWLSAGGARLEKCRDPRRQPPPTAAVQDAFSVNVTFSIVCGPRGQYARRFRGAAIASRRSRDVSQIELREIDAHGESNERRFRNGELRALARRLLIASHRLASKERLEYKIPSEKKTLENLLSVGYQVSCTEINFTFHKKIS